MDWLHGIPVLVLGLGDSGLAMARWCARFGAEVTVWDSRETPPGAEKLATELPQVRRIGGELLPSQLSGIQLVLKSPGLSPLDPRVAPLLHEARHTGIAILGELDLFARALADLKARHGYAPQVLAITGTNGKTTTTALTALLAQRAGKRVVMAGNIGPTLLDTLAAALDAAGDALQAPVEAAVEPVAEEPADGVMPAEAPEAAADEPAEDPLSEPAPEPAPEPAAEAPVEAPPPETAAAADDPLAERPLPIQPPPPPPPDLPLPQVWVLELSSFQLQGGGFGLSPAAWGFEPTAAVVLNVTQDHLDWHGTMAAYTAAKARVYGSQALMVVNRDDPAVLAMVPAPVPVKGKPRAKPVTRAAVHFGLGAPQRPGDFGLVEENGMAWLVRALPADETVKRRKDEEEEIHLQRLMPADALRLRGRHNAANALAALALATTAGCALAPMLHGLREYEGEPHRVQFVGSVGEVEAFDDSKGTNVGATVAALNGLGADKAPAKLVVILGGDGKGQDFAPLAEPLARHARAVATIGRDAAAIEAAIGLLPLQRHETLQAAVAWCFDQAQPGDAVLLSPACASLDMFRNYAHRAEVFVEAVQALAADRGQV